MKRYDLWLERNSELPAETTALYAESPAAVFGWAQRNAPGRKFEVFLDGRSLGGAMLRDDDGFWVLTGPAEHPASVAENNGPLGWLDKVLG
jgi:hypothetical protein